MKRFRLLTLLTIAFLVVCASFGIANIAVAADEEARIYSPHAESVQVWNNKIYVLFNTEYHEGMSYYDYMASEVIEFDAELNKLRSVKLESAGNSGKNAAGMALYDGKLYVGCRGGLLGGGLWGDVWEVDAAAMTAKQVLDVEKVSGLTTAATPYAISIAADGTAFCLIGYYDSTDWSFISKLYVTTAAKLSAGDIGTAAPDTESKSGAYWNLAYEDAIDTLWFMAGEQIEARDKAGALLRAFKPADLGDNAASIAVWKGGSGINGIFYAAITSDYTAASVGTITRNGDDFVVNADEVTNFGGDTQGFTFLDHNGADRALVREYNYGPNDFVKIYDPTNWTAPIKDVSGWASNIHNVTSHGRFLYLTAYESYEAGASTQDPGEVVRVDMGAGYVRDRSYQAEAIVVGDGSTGESGGGSSGCDAGASVLAALAFVALSHTLRRCRAKK